MSQRTSTSVEVEPVSAGLARQIGRMAEDAVLKYPGGNARAELAKGNPAFGQQFNDLIERLASQRAETLPLIERPPFLTIRVGTLKTEPDLRQAVLDAECRISNWASDLMSRPAFASGIAQAEEDVDFVIVSNAELGYPNGCAQAQTYEAGLKLGWKLCLPSDAIEIRRNYPDQPVGEWLLIAMNPIADSGGDPEVFIVGHDRDGLWLYGRYGFPGSFWRDGRWVFRRK